MIAKKLIRTWIDLCCSSSSKIVFENTTYLIKLPALYTVQMFGTGLDICKSSESNSIYV